MIFPTDFSVFWGQLFCSGGSKFWSQLPQQQPEARSPRIKLFTTSENTAFTIRPNSQVYKKHVSLQFQSCVKTGHTTHCLCVQDTVPFHKNEKGFPGGSAGKECTCNAGDLGLIPGLGRSPGEGKGYLSSILAWRIPWSVKCMGSQRVGHDWPTFKHSSKPEASELYKDTSWTHYHSMRKKG